MMFTNRDTANPLDGAVFHVEVVQLGNGGRPESVLAREIIQSPRLDDTYTIKSQVNPINRLATPVVIRIRRMAYDIADDLLTRSLSAVATVELSRN